MFPGGGRGMNPKQLNQMMKQLGIKVEELDDVEEVIIRRATKDTVIREAEVTIMTAQGTRTYQIVGEAVDVPRAAGADAAAAPAPAATYSDDDVKLVMEGAGVSAGDAKKALDATNGETAEAIIHLLDKKGKA
ncbi:MAG: nascent polypeptide-associated complex protein [Thermoplasmatota archaeon]